MPHAEFPAVTLRPLARNDRDMLFRWQQIPAVRRYARNPTVPSWSEHCAWFDAKMSGGETRIQIIQNGGIDAGVVQLTPTDGDATLPGPLAYEISIYLDPAHAGRGVGLAALRLLRARVPEAVLLAEVLPDNHASHSLFLRAGYDPLGNGWYRSIPVSTEATPS